LTNRELEEAYQKHLQVDPQVKNRGEFMFDKFDYDNDRARAM
jgi:hypothetical protein